MSNRYFFTNAPPLSPEELIYMLFFNNNYRYDNHYESYIEKDNNTSNNINDDQELYQTEKTYFGENTDSFEVRKLKDSDNDTSNSTQFVFNFKQPSSFNQRDNKLNTSIQVEYKYNPFIYSIASTDLKEIFHQEDSQTKEEKFDNSCGIWKFDPSIQFITDTIPFLIQQIRNITGIIRYPDNARNNTDATNHDSNTSTTNSTTISYISDCLRNQMQN